MPTYTVFKKLEKPDLAELYDINSANRNNDIIDSELHKIENNMDLLASDFAATADNKVDKVSGKGLSTNDFTDEDKNKLDGITSGTIVTDDLTTTFEEAKERENIVSGEKVSVMFGKIRKWLSDMKSAAFCSVADNLVTTASGSVLDARQGKALDERITGLHSEITDIKLLSPSYISKTVSHTNLEIKNNKATFVLNKDTVISAIAVVSSTAGNAPTVIIAGTQGSSYPVSNPDGGVVSHIPYLALKAGTYTVSTSGTRLMSASIGFME